MIDNAANAEICELYRSESGKLLGYALRLTVGNRPEAEDLVDETFHDVCRQWARVSTYDTRGRSAWLRRVVKNKAVSAHRKHDRVITFDLQHDEGQLVRRSTDVDEAHAQLARDLLDQCSAVIQTLPSNLRLAIGLRVEGICSREIAELMGIDSSTVRGYWAQVIKELEDKVGPVLRILDGPDGEELA